MTAVIERMESDLETLKENSHPTSFERFAAVAAAEKDCEVRYAAEPGENAAEIGRRIAQVLTGLMRQDDWNFARLARESGVTSVTNVKRIVQGGWKLLHVGHFCSLCLALNASPGWVIQEALKKKSAIRDMGKWGAEDLRKTRHAKIKKGKK